MTPVTQLRTRIGNRALLLTTAVIPLTGWAVHATALHRRLASTKRDPLPGPLRRDAYTHRASRLLGRPVEHLLPRRRRRPAAR